MRRVDFGMLLLAIAIASAGCGGEDGGGTGGTGPATAFSFDAETSEQAGGAAAAAAALATRFGAITANVFSALAGGLGAASQSVRPKINIPVPGFCQEGTATLDWQPSGTSSNLSAGDTVILALDGCSGSAVSGMPANGTVELDITDVGGGLPVIGGIISATVSLDLSIAPDTTITGNFALSANLPNFSLANLFFGARQESDLITVSEGSSRVQLACFDIYQRVGLAGPGIEFFRPVGVMKLANQVFTLNSYEEGAPNIGFVFAGFDATPQSGSLTLASGDRSGGLCAGFSENPTPNESFVTATFTGGGCVTLDGTDTEGMPFNRIATWDSLLDPSGPGGPTDQCDMGTGGTGGTPTTPAMASPVSCAQPGDLVAIADAYIRGDGSDGVYSGTPYGTATNLLIKSVGDQSFTRKIYIAFDVSPRRPFDPVNPGFDKAYLVLTLQRHIENDDPTKSGPQPVDVFGISDDNDWDPAAPGLGENEITWANAPKNVTAIPSQPQFESQGVPLLIPAYDFDLPPVGVIDPGPASDPPGVTRYALDITEYVKERLENDADGKISVLMAASNPMSLNQDGSAFFSLQAEECDRPFLHFE